MLITRRLHSHHRPPYRGTTHPDPPVQDMIGYTWSAPRLASHVRKCLLHFVRSCSFHKSLILASGPFIQSITPIIHVPMWHVAIFMTFIFSINACLLSLYLCSVISALMINDQHHFTRAVYCSQLVVRCLCYLCYRMLPAVTRHQMARITIRLGPHGGGSEGVRPPAAQPTALLSGGKDMVSVRTSLGAEARMLKLKSRDRQIPAYYTHSIEQCYR
jgi:hypothetical protein